MTHLLALPPELRLLIYTLLLADHQRVSHRTQPTNVHLRPLRTCTLLYAEAAPVLSAYVSLRNEVQITRFLHSLTSERASLVNWADVANDGRVLHDPSTNHIEPASQLYLALARLSSLAILRVFHFRITLRQGKPNGEWTLWVLILVMSRKRRLISPSSLLSLRLSGDCHFPASNRTTPLALPSLLHLSLSAITSNAFDTLDFSRLLPHSRLLSFSHSQGHRLAFELRDPHLASLLRAPSPALSLRKLVLLGSSRLSSHALSTFIQSLHALDYLALSLVTVNELRHNFIHGISPHLTVLKLQVTNAWYAVPLYDEVGAVCDALEERVLKRDSGGVQLVCVSFYPKLMAEDGRAQRWRDIADQRRFTLKIGPWEEDEET
ncbi:hypothetical protein SERLADRAFT_417835 [Serpula lacrymans var. lacrymans S7.9]|uniref:F-box domain-containing protein n=1 Tax=Serpula lacrymans var. lacrymans (strain S7.9) TaxID=578457 RepID=F8P8C3_SERL9|nr:uncharacterized protein SERLADRAFT_417835 [Serpula lacrymans var. lacrymans S7.9]EGO20679.1 hypothetical protein SERLADRAFT_417835 [Serpula lacrymans var. lacrymans S7.9]